VGARGLEELASRDSYSTRNNRPSLSKHPTPTFNYQSLHTTHKMSSTSLQFGPEWMRNKQQPSASTTRPASLLSPILPSTSPPAPGTSSYSSLLTPAPPAPPEKQESVNPFLYSKEELLQVWKDGGGRGGLGLEVELWEGVVREIGGEPIGLREMSEGEKKVRSASTSRAPRRSALIVRVFYLRRDKYACIDILWRSQFGPASSPVA
jgi:hypothetical protein